ncbi:LysR family transcriptional regulator [Caballeronia sp. DA-9]|uniref:LysR family transcriptional regulator n=1 Tax=Caballeronia sp. DA-9 TaxID=3436237 RepID=UPI003F67C58B
MDLIQLDMFVRVAEQGSLSKASLQYDVGPSAISRQLASLEAECQGRLLHRTGRGVRLTELGERLLPRARAVLDEMQALQEEISAAANICRGTVHIGCVPSVAAEVITEVVRVAREQYPQVMIHAASALSGQVEQWLAEGSIDLGFVMRKGIGKDEGEDPLAVVKMCLVGPAGDRLTLTKELDFKVLDGLPLLQPSAPSPYRASIAQTARQLGVKLNVVAEVDSLQLTKELVAARVGYALLSISAILPELKDGRLSATYIVNPEIVGSVYLMTSKVKTASLAGREVSRLIRHVARRLSEAGTWDL